MWTASDLVTDVTEGDWIAPAISDFRTAGGDGQVGGILPPRFDAYARILHPAYRSRSATVGASDLIRWVEVAEANGSTLHALAEWEFLLPSRSDRMGQPGIWEKGPGTGRIEPPVRRTLESILAAHTSTPERCWYAIWEGNTILDDVRDIGGRVRAYGLEFFLVRDELQVPDEERDLNTIPPHCGGRTTALGVCPATATSWRPMWVGPTNASPRSLTILIWKLSRCRRRTRSRGTATRSIRAHCDSTPAPGPAQTSTDDSAGSTRNSVPSEAISE